MTDARHAALRPLHELGDSLGLLREPSPDPSAARSAVLRVVDGVDRALRSLLRDDPGQSLETRLRAQASGEMPAQEVLSALRQHDRVSIQLAAALHDLLAARERLLRGAEPARTELDLALNVAERVEREIYALRMPAAPPAAGAAGATMPGAEPRPVDTDAGPGPGGGGSRWQWAVLAAGVVLLIVLGLVVAERRSAPRMDEAIALFRTGDLERAAAQFERHAAARPRDPTPRLYLARIHRRGGRYEAAGEQLRLGLEAAPDDAGLHRELGLLLLDLDRADAAVGRFRAAVELEPESAEGWLGLVRALRESGQHDAAERVIARAPESARNRLRPGAPPARP